MLPKQSSLRPTLFSIPALRLLLIRTQALNTAATINIYAVSAWRISRAAAMCIGTSARIQRRKWTRTRTIRGTVDGKGREE